MGGPNVVNTVIKAGKALFKSPPSTGKRTQEQSSKALLRPDGVPTARAKGPEGPTRRGELPGSHRGSSPLRTLAEDTAPPWVQLLDASTLAANSTQVPSDASHGNASTNPFAGSNVGTETDRRSPLLFDSSSGADLTEHFTPRDPARSAFERANVSYPESDDERNNSLSDTPTRAGGRADARDTRGAGRGGAAETPAAKGDESGSINAGLGGAGGIAGAGLAAGSANLAASAMNSGATGMNAAGNAADLASYAAQIEATAVGERQMSAMMGRLQLEKGCGTAVAEMLKDLGKTMSQLAQ